MEKCWFVVMRILITGGSGFIARNLSEKLNDKYELSVYGSKELNLLDSVKVFEFIKKNKFDVVIHTATYDAAPKHSIKDPTKVLENNLRMFFNVVRCSKHFGKMIYFGSGAEFDREFWEPKMEEKYFDKHVPTDQYGFSKYIMTKYLESCKNIYNLRLFGVFGKYDDWKTRLIPNVCYQTLVDKSVVIDQNKYVDFLYVDDLVRIVDWFINNQPKNNVYNVCTGKVIDFVTILKKIISLSNESVTFKITKKGLGKEYSGDNNLLLRELKEFIFTPIDESLRDLYDWYNLNKNVLFN